MKKIIPVSLLFLALSTPAIALDFAGFISANATALSAEQKIALLSDYCEFYKYDENKLVGETKAQFFNRYVVNYIKKIVNMQRKQAAEEAVTYDALGDLE